MKCNKFIKYADGFSLVESVIVIALMSFFAVASFSSFRESRNHAELRGAEYTVVRTFEKARSRAVSGVGEKSHGVHVDEGSVILFEGESYVAGVGTIFHLGGNVTTDQTDFNVIFKRLSGEPQPVGTVTLTHRNGASAAVSVLASGAIEASE